MKGADFMTKDVNRYNRSIVISSPIDDEVAKEVIEKINEINYIDFDLSENLKDYKPEPIEIFINSEGGSADDGFAIIGAMEMSDTPIITYGLGEVSSMALAIFVSGDYRLAHRHCRFLYHPIYYGISGTIEDHRQHYVASQSLLNKYNEIILERTKFPKKLMDDAIKTKTDYFFDVNEALKYGVVDGIIQRVERKIVLQEEGEEE